MVVQRQTTGSMKWLALSTWQTRTWQLFRFRSAMFDICIISLPIVCFHPMMAQPWNFVSFYSPNSDVCQYSRIVPMEWWWCGIRAPYTSKQKIWSGNNMKFLSKLVLPSKTSVCDFKIGWNDHCWWSVCWHLLVESVTLLTWNRLILFYYCIAELHGRVNTTALHCNKISNILAPTVEVVLSRRIVWLSTEELCYS